MITTLGQGAVFILLFMVALGLLISIMIATHNTNIDLLGWIVSVILAFAIYIAVSGTYLLTLQGYI